MILDWFAKYALVRKEYDLVHKYLKECVVITKRFLPPSDDQRMVLMSDYGVACQRIGKIEEAIRALKEAVRYASEKGDESENLGIFLYNLGMCYLKNKDNNNGHFCCLRALKFANDNGDKQLQIKCRKCLKAATEGKDPTTIKQ
jgi:tetratricopeptide (TPR) repeat protein